jgi:hypothetical protein
MTEMTPILSLVATIQFYSSTIPNEAMRKSNQRNNPITIKKRTRLKSA